MNMMTSNYIATVYNGFCHNPKISAEAKDRISPEFMALLDRNEDAGLIEGIATKILADLPDLQSGKSQLRYRFKLSTSREQLLKLIFDRSFEHIPNVIVDNAVKVDPIKKPYPNWKKICWIKIPGSVGVVIKNPVFKVAIGITTICLSIFSLLAVYKGMSVLLTAKVLPVVINHTPLVVIKMGNLVADAVKIVLDNPLRIFFGIWLTREAIVRLPTIPYITDFARRLSMWDVFDAIVMSPATIYHFIGKSAGDACRFVVSECDSAGSFFQSISVKEENKRTSIAHKIALDVWNGIVKANDPQTAAFVG